MSLVLARSVLGPFLVLESLVFESPYLVFSVTIICIHVLYTSEMIN